MALKIVERPAVTVVGLRILTKPMSPEIAALWPRFVSRIGEIAHATEPYVSYGVMRDPDASMSQLDYMAAVAVADAATLPAGMESTVLPAGIYAFFAYPLSGLGAGFGEIYSRHLPGSGYQQADGPYFERYNEAFNPADPNSMVEIYLPVDKE